MQKKLLSDKITDNSRHMLKTPLTNIKAYVSLLKRDWENNNKKNALYFTKLEIQINKLNKMIDEIFSK